MILRILLVTDAWEPQVNGVVRTLKTTARELTAMGHEVRFLTPLEFRTLPCPTYPEIRLSLFPQSRVNRVIREFDPDVLHIATEGPLGMAARRHALRHDFPFTTAYHTRFPEYVHARFRLPIEWSYAWLRRFHGPSRAVMAPTQVVVDDLVDNGFERVKLWSRGVDTDIFHPQPSKRLDSTPPTLFATGSPARATLGNATFGLRSGGNVPGQVNALATTDVPGSGGIPIGACTFWLPGTLEQVYGFASTTTDGAGFASYSLPVPADVSLEGLTVSFQALGVNPGGGGTFNVFDFSDGLAVRVGTSIAPCE